MQIELLHLAIIVDLSNEPATPPETVRSDCLALLQRSPDDPWALNNMAEFCIDYSHPRAVEQGVEYGSRAYRSSGLQGEADPRIADTYGWALVLAGRGADAIPVLKSAADKLPIPETQYHLAKAYLSVGDHKAAWPCLTAALLDALRDQAKGLTVQPDLRQGVVNAFWQLLRESVAPNTRGFY